MNNAILKHRGARQVELVQAWNAKHKTGTDVIYRRDVGDPMLTTTNSAAQMLGGHTAVIWVEGVSSCVALERVSPRRGDLMPIYAAREA